MDAHHGVDASAAAVALAAYFGWLPAVASVMSIIWVAIGMARLAHGLYQARKTRRQMATCTNMECRCSTYCARATERNWK